MTLPSLADALLTLDLELPEAVEIRRELHREPMIGGEEEPVAQRLAELLGRGDAGSVADGRVLRFGPEDGPAIALRAELDALPVHEETGVVWASTNGKMHACGHDVHQAALVAVVRTLVRLQAPIGLLAVLQPREEVYPCGAPDIIGSAEWRKHDIVAVVAAHVQPQLPAGSVSAPAGPINASADEFLIKVIGKGGHAAYPHTIKDPVLAAASTVVALQQVVARLSNPMEPAVLSVGSVNGGSAANVIPDVVRLRGTLRSFGAQQRSALLDQLRSIAGHVAAAHGCEAEVVVSHGEPVMVNDRALATGASEKFRQLGFDDAVEIRSCGADDFSYYGGEAPALMVFVGTGRGPSDVGLHDARYLPADDAVRDVARVLLAAFYAAAELLPESSQSVRKYDRRDA